MWSRISPNLMREKEREGPAWDEVHQTCAYASPTVSRWTIPAEGTTQCKKPTTSIIHPLCTFLNFISGWNIFIKMIGDELKPK